MYNIDSEEELLQVVQQKMLELNEARANYQNDKTEDNKNQLDLLELEYIDFRNYWRRIGEALGLRFGVSVQ